VGIGFDGQGSGPVGLVLEPAARFEVVADSGGIGTIAEYRSGRHGESEPDVVSSVTLGGADLEIDLTAFVGTTSSPWTLAAADSISGTFGTVTAPGLGSSRDLTVTVTGTSVTVAVTAGRGGISLN
jgi:hypothetical protein